MKPPNLLLVLAVATVTALTLSCSQNASEPTAEASDASASAKNLGVVELSDATPSRVDLGAGKECIITPKVISDNALQIDIVVEAKDAAGNPKRVGSSRVTTLAGQSFAISVGDTTVAMTPQIKSR
jgi:hypothetical protein